MLASLRTESGAFWYCTSVELELPAEAQLAFGLQRLDRGDLVGAAACLEILREQLVDRQRVRRHRRERERNEKYH